MSESLARDAVSPNGLSGLPIPSTAPRSDSRLIHRTVDLSTLPKIDGDFYRNDVSASQRFVSFNPERFSLTEAWVALVLAKICVDEREADLEETLMIPPGTFNIIPMAGAKSGEPNLNLSREIQAKIEKAHRLGKTVIILIVTHESKAFPHTDSCAAWNQSREHANAYATQKVARYNRSYVERDSDDEIVKRYLTAFHIRSITDTEAKIWCGDDGQELDPTDFVGQPTSNLAQVVHERFCQLYPLASERFKGFNAVQWNGIIDQLTMLCVGNVNYLRKLAETPHRKVKYGHRGRRTLVGRGWEMYTIPNKAFRVSDYLSKDDMLANCRIAATYTVRNALKERGRVGATFHVNILYDADRPGDRSGSIDHAMSLGRVIKEDLTKLFTDPEERRRFDRKIRDAFRHDGHTWSSLPLKVRKAYRTDLAKGLRIYVSVSQRQTRALELVATIADL